MGIPARAASEESRRTTSLGATNHQPLGRIGTRVTLQMLLDHVILGCIFCAGSTAGIIFSGLVALEIITMPVLIPLALPILACFGVCFACGAGMIIYHIFARVPEKKISPGKVVAKGEQPESAPLISSGLASASSVPAALGEAFGTKFKDIDVTTVPWINIGIPNPSSFCFASTALQSLFQMPHFRTLIYLIVKLTPDVEQVHPVIFATFEIMRCMQLGPPASVPERVYALLKLIDGRCDIIFAGALHDSRDFTFYFLDELSNDFYRDDTFVPFVKRISDAERPLSEAESATLECLHIPPENGQNLGDWFARIEKSFFIFLPYITCEDRREDGKTLHSAPCEIYTHGIHLNFASSNCSCQETLERFLAPHHVIADDSSYYNDDRSAYIPYDLFRKLIHPACITFTAERTSVNAAGRLNAYGVQIEKRIHLPANAVVNPVAEYYELGQISCHTGTEMAGHWFTYIKCSNGQWRKFDDANVTVVANEKMENMLAQWKLNGAVNGEMFMGAKYFPVFET
ncbi:MAG: ubiquitin carboxyl-terminal hydrolase [Puniceicoccales bacterium]|jgi:hypothetical protein|nr:ubiquitin carboxyl-terminal hydrolase [Puniceicoccales bacterium]